MVYQRVHATARVLLYSAHLQYCHTAQQAYAPLPVKAQVLLAAALSRGKIEKLRNFSVSLHLVVHAMERRFNKLNLWQLLYLLRWPILGANLSFKCSNRCFNILN